jgi:DNA-binding winged helix-turn-helix (wHTH) protein
VKLQFGQFLIDTDTRQLFEGSEERHLTPKAFDLLCILSANRPNALSKGELHDRLWPSTFVSETNLAMLVAEIRRLLRDPAKVPRIIRTVHRFGYAFVADPVTSPRAHPSSGEACWLVSRSRQFALGDGEHVVGRAADVHVLLDSAGVSRRHARILVSGDAVLIEDLDSKNGTWVAGQRITAPHALADGDRVRFGTTTLTFRSWTDGGSTRSVRRAG